MELRNADRSRLTSLSWAAIEGGLEVFEWLLLDYGHDDQELSRVSYWVQGGCQLGHGSGTSWDRDQGTG